MVRNTFRTLVAFAVVGVTVAAADQAQAFGWRHRGWGGSHGSSGSWGSSGGSWGSHGSSGGWYYGSSGSSGSSGGWYYGSSGSSGGSWGSHGSSGSSGGSWGSHGSSGGYHSAPQAPTAPQAPAGTPAPPTPAPPAPADAGSDATTYHPTYGPMRSSAYLSVKVPAGAKVFVNDRPTTSTGTDREYVSHDLQNGARYNYTIRAEYERDGKPVTETKSVQLTAGQRTALDFSGETSVQTADNTDSRTSLIVRLPADAKLYLGGHETKATGEVREFSTTRLPGGAEWNEYTIRAVVERDGRELVRNETISIKAGDSREVTINFDTLGSDQVAETASR
jgi:uncharacterized protein (TIGR03000 family)